MNNMLYQFDSGESFAENIDLPDGWEVSSFSDDFVRINSPNRQDQLVVKIVSVTNDEIGEAFHVEHFVGENPYSSNRTRETSVIAEDVNRLSEEISDLINNSRN